MGQHIMNNNMQYPLGHDYNPSAEPSAQFQWWSKSAAGLILGFTFALAINGIFAWLGPNGIEVGSNNPINLWIVISMWAMVFSTCYLFKTGLQAWYWLSTANVIAYLLNLLTKMTLS